MSSAWTFLFDIGGVLLDFDLAALARRAGRGDLARGSGLLRLREHPSLAEIESGRIEGEAYFHQYIRPEAPHWTFRDMVEGWKAVFRENADGFGLLAFARERGARICFLSNMAAFNKTAIEERFPGFFGLCDRRFLSFEIGLTKPDPRIYEWALAETGAEARRCVFVDDRPENVAAARAVGMNGFVFESGRAAAIRNEWTRLLAAAS